MTSTNLPPPPTPPLTSSVPASSTKPSAPRKTSSDAFRTCMTDGIASAWSTRREATIKRPPIATAKSSTSFAPTPTTTMRASTRCSSSSSKNSNPPRAECSPGRKPIWLPKRAQYPKASYPRLSHTEIPKLRFRSQIAWPWSRGWRLVTCAIRSCNRSLAKKRALGLQVRDPHNRDYIPIVVRLLFCVLVAGPHEILFGHERLSILVKPHLAFGDMADHGILHRGTHSLRARLHNDIAH